VFYDGELIESLSWTPLETFISHLRQQVPDDLFEKCESVSVAGEAEKGKGLHFLVQLGF
jgi:hypothetical protein